MNQERIQEIAQITAEALLNHRLPQRERDIKSSPRELATMTQSEFNYYLSLVTQYMREKRADV